MWFAICIACIVSALLVSQYGHAQGGNGGGSSLSSCSGCSRTYTRSEENWEIYIDMREADLELLHHIAEVYDKKGKVRAFMNRRIEQMEAEARKKKSLLNQLDEIGFDPAKMGTGDLEKLVDALKRSK